MVSPKDREFFPLARARKDREEAVLRRWADPAGPLGTILGAEFLDEDRRGQLEPYFRAHLLCALAAVAPEFWPETGTVSGGALGKIQTETKLPLSGPSHN